MPELDIRPYRDSDQAAVIDLWQACNLVVPWNDPRSDINLKVAFQPDLLLVGTLQKRLVATAMAGYEGHRGWINYLAVAPDLQRQGIGRRMMEAAERTLRALGCPKVNLQVRSTNRQVIAFYERLGYAVEDVVNMGKRFR